MKNNTLIFLHIPKTAGRTLQNIVIRKYKKDECFVIDGGLVKESIKKFKNLPVESIKNIKLLQGHMPFGLHKYLPNQSTYITFLRNPVDRIILIYHYILRTPEHYLYHDVAKSCMSLDDFVTSEITIELDNGQIRLLAGVDTELEYGKCDNELYDTALYNFKNYFTFIGLFEKFDDSLILMAKALGWASPPYYYKHNVTKKNKSNRDISKDIIAKIEKNNIYDMRLYKEISIQFEQIRNEQMSDFNIQLHKFRVYNNIYQKVVAPYWLIRSVLRKTRSFIRP